MERYETIREDGWKLLWRDAIEPLEEGEYPPKAKVISFFCKRNPSDPEINITKALQKVDPYVNIKFDILKEVSWLEERLNHVLRYTKKWNNYNIYQCIALQEYLNQCKNGGYSRCILSKQELAMLLPKKK